jgi:hypothetical protein
MGLVQQWRLLSRVHNISWISAVRSFLECHNHDSWTIPHIFSDLIRKRVKGIMRGPGQFMGQDGKSLIRARLLMFQRKFG